MITLDDVLTNENIQTALDNLLGKRDSCGIDGIMVSQYKEYWELNGKSILEQIYNGKYEPGIVQNHEIITSNGKRRIIAKYNCTDRLILRAIYECMVWEVENGFSEYSFAYSKGKGIQKAVRQAADYIEAGYEWVFETDIEDCFDSIPLEPLSDIILKYVQDGRLVNLIKKYLYCRVETEYGDVVYKKCGIVQGNPLSPLLCNMYLHQLDEKLHRDGVKFCRFADDINIFFKTREEAVRYYNIYEDYLKILRLKLCERKTGIFPAMNRRFLGYEFYCAGKSRKVLIKRRTVRPDVYYHNWHKSAIQKINNDYHLIRDGILSKHDYTILFDNGEKRYIPVEAVSSINIYSNVIFSSSFFEFIHNRSLRVVMYDKYGRHIGSFTGDTKSDSSTLLLKQAEIYLDMPKRLQLAKKFMISAIHNMRANLKYYYKHNRSESIATIISELSRKISEINEASGIGEVLLTEARSRQIYYQSFNKMVNNEGFCFVQRTKRPPKDEINALISFGNVFLYQRVATEIYKSSLDIRIGFLHASNRRCESLNLDIAEIFKPVIVDRVIFKLINKKMLNCDEHFEKSQNGTYLNLDGKRLFITELEAKLRQKITIDNRTITYQSVIRAEVRKLVRHLRYGEKYSPYKYY